MTQLNKNGLDYIKSIDDPYYIYINQDWIKTFDAVAIIGDLHGCLDELYELEKIIKSKYGSNIAFIFTGDLIDRGPYSYDTCRYIWEELKCSSRIVLCGNHEKKILNKIRKNESATYRSQKWINDLTDKQKEQYIDWHLDIPIALGFMFKDRWYNVAHAAWPESINCWDKDNWLNKKEAALCWYGHTTGEKTPEGFPVRFHEPNRLSNTTNIFGHIIHMVDKQKWWFKDEPGDTVYIDHGCVVGGLLSAFVISDKGEEVISVKPKELYWNNIDPEVK